MSRVDLSECSVDELLSEIRSRDHLGVEIDDVRQVPDFSITHTQCVEFAARYMEKRAPVVLPEFFCHNSELPDVIAFTSRDSTVIECKVSRGDFLSDKRKPFRINSTAGMGDYRYYCCPKGLIQPDELPQGWGLLWVYPDGKIRKQRDGIMPLRKNDDAEKYLLFYYARRANFAGVHKTILEYRGYDA